MPIPDRVRDVVEARLGAVRSATPVGGGCINEAFRVESRNGTAFLKYNGKAPPDFFAREAEGLCALARATGALRTPEVLDVGDEWLLLEWIESTRRSDASDAALGRAVAALHGVPAGGWGWESGNYLGAAPQANDPAASWPEFWRDRRLAPVLARIGASAPVPGGDLWDRLLDTLDARLAAGEDEGASLVHGDLWSGNVMVGSDGAPVLVDPAVYRGHREVDVAMTELFGGFSPAFAGGYGEVLPLHDGYARRRPVYQLYYLLVHVELFGASYVPRTLAALDSALAE